MDHEMIEKEANLIIISDLTENLQDSWIKSGRDIDKFMEFTKDFLDSYIARSDTKTRNDLKNSITKITGGKIKLEINSNREWKLVLSH